MAPKRPRDEADQRAQLDSNNSGSGEVFESSPIKDRQSTFIAAFTPSTTVTPKTLQARPEYASASHRILGWRKASKQQRLNASSGTSGGSGSSSVLYETGSDDDGEKYAGKKLEKVLVEMDVVGVIVVARWYGGVMLGPVRFAHIEGVAREAIEKWRGVQPGGKRVKVDAGAPASTNSSGDVASSAADDVDPEEEQRQKDALAKQLENRDTNIVTLRGLLAEKQAAKANGRSQDGSSQKGAGRAAPPLDYSRMPLPALKKLEKARDATIAWILKQLDEVEAEGEKEAT